MRWLLAGIAGVLLALVPGSASSAPDPTTVVFDYTGALQTFTVPAGVTSITVTLDGAQGGAGCLADGPVTDPASAGGKGARVVATLPVTPGETYEVRAGGSGGHPGNGLPDQTGCPIRGGFNGGGGFPADGSGPQVSGGGGGASDLRLAGGAPLLVAGGGGGGGGHGVTTAGSAATTGGAGGDSGAAGTAGQGFADPSAGAGGGAGTPSAGGSGGTAGTTDANDSSYGFADSGNPGTAGAGGAPGTAGWNGGAGGGGGGGYYGGGAGGSGAGPDNATGAAGGGGGGGSSYAPPAGSTITEGQRTGDGRVVISYVVQQPATTTTTTTTAVETTPSTPTVTTPVVPEPPVAEVVPCAGRELTLTELHVTRTGTDVRGVALMPLAGRRVRISGDHGGGNATALVAADGSFAATLPRPRSAQTSYIAAHGTARSAPIKLTRHLTVVSETPVANGLRVVARHAKGARVAGELAHLVGQIGCGARTTFAGARFDRNGRVTFLLPAPTAPDTVAVYRIGARTNRTFSLPIVVRR